MPLIGRRDGCHGGLCCSTVLASHVIANPPAGGRTGAGGEVLHGVLGIFLPRPGAGPARPPLPITVLSSEARSLLLS